MNYYKIIDIKDVKTFKTRTDGRYPLRIGSIVSLHTLNLWNGRCAILEYHKDNQGGHQAPIRHRHWGQWCKTGSLLTVHPHLLSH